MDPLEITADVRFILITGSPGAGKSTVAKLVFCAQSEEWRLFDLDAYFNLTARRAPGPDNWDTFEANYDVRAASIAFYGSRGGRVIAEGIVQSDREVSAYCAAVGITPTSTAFRFYNLTLPRDEAAERMDGRPIRELAQARATLDDHRRHYDYITTKLRASGAKPFDVSRKPPEQVARELVADVNESPPR